MTLAEYLKVNNLTEAAFAEKSGLSQPTVNRLKQGKSRPTWANIVAIQNATGNRVNAADWLEVERR